MGVCNGIDAIATYKLLPRSFLVRKMVQQREQRPRQLNYDFQNCIYYTGKERKKQNSDAFSRNNLSLSQIMRSCTEKNLACAPQLVLQIE